MTTLKAAAAALRDANRRALALQDFTDEATEALAKGALNAATVKLDEIIAIQNADGNWNYDAYMMGLANGLIMARSILTDEDPQFLSAPAEWLADRVELLAPIEQEDAAS